MAQIKTFNKIAAGKRAHELTLGIYRITRDFAAEEKFGLTSQIRRSAVSIALAPHRLYLGLIKNYVYRNCKSSQSSKKS
jgi:hypothetical protein